MTIALIFLLVLNAYYIGVKDGKSGIWDEILAIYREAREIRKIRMMMKHRKG